MTQCKNMLIDREPNRPVELLVTSSSCILMKEGSRILLNGPLLDYEKSSPVCVTALTGIYPWVVAARFGIASETLEWREDGYRVWCPEKQVEFAIRPVEV